ncbi:MAG: rRNA cytosine-C5-methyltransferase [Rikenellaceae bacterium]
MLNNQFIELLGEIVPPVNTSSFIESINRPTSSFVRLNNAKTMPFSFEGTPVKWCSNGIRLVERKVFTTDPFFHGGAYYVQEASSMFIEQLFKKIIFKEKANALKALDLCAAPGGKSTHISSLIGKDSLLVANEVIRSRAAVLKENIIKWGIGNTVVTSNDPSHFSSLPSFFDVVVVDAPCSGEGMFRKNEKARDEWSMGNVELCQGRSRRILSDVWETLADGGFLIYSTCTFNRRENEENVKWLTEEFDAELAKTKIDEFEEVLLTDYGYRFHPDRVDSEGYFVAIVRKLSGGNSPKKDRLTPLVKEKTVDLTQWLNESEKFTSILYNNSVWAVPEAWNSEITLLLAKLNVLYFGIEIGELFGKKLKPSHALSLAAALNREQNEVYDLSLEDALNYLRRQSIEPYNMVEGFNLVGYEGVPIGWVKRIGNRTNNLYPKESRILNL